MCGIAIMQLNCFVLLLPKKKKIQYIDVMFTVIRSIATVLCVCVCVGVGGCGCVVLLLLQLNCIVPSFSDTFTVWMQRLLLVVPAED